MQIAEAADASLSGDEDDAHAGLRLDECTSDEDDDAYDDALHDCALDDYQEQSCLTHVLDRYDADLLKETWQEYVGSVGTPARMEVHQAKLMSFRGYGPDPRPFLNPLFESMWLPWAIDAQYCHNEDIGLLRSEAGALGLDLRMLAAHLCMDAAIPTRPVLEYMVNHAPNRKIAHIDGTSSTYWASLLRCLGANILLVTDDSFAGRSKPSSFGDFHTIGERRFFERSLGNEHVLFFCQHSEKSEGVIDDDGEMSCCLFERCLSCFPGDMVFFVGEIGKTTKSFDMAQWVVDNSEQGWQIKEEIELPCWPGSQDVFLCCVKEELEHEASVKVGLRQNKSLREPRHAFLASIEQVQIIISNLFG